MASTKISQAQEKVPVKPRASRGYCMSGCMLVVSLLVLGVSVGLGSFARSYYSRPLGQWFSLNEHSVVYNFAPGSNNTEV